MAAARPVANAAPARWPLLRDGLALLAIGLGVLIAIAVFLPPEGRIAGPLHDAVALLLGRGSFLLPIALVLVGLLVLVQGAHPDLRLPGPRMVGAALLAVAYLPSIHLVGLGSTDSLERALARDGGGLVGYWLASALLDWLGGPITAVALALSLAIGGLLFFDVTVAQALIAIAIAAAWLWQRLLGIRSLRLSSGGRPAQAVRSVARVRLPSLPRRRFVVTLPKWRRPLAPIHPRFVAVPAPRHSRLSPSAPAPLPPFRPAPRSAPESPAAPPAPVESVPDASLAAPADPPDESPADEPEWRRPELSLFQARSAAEVGGADLAARSRVIEDTLASFNIEAKVIEANRGPTVTQFGIEPAPGVAVNRIMSRQNDLALRLGASPIRLEAPVPGKRMVGVEVPNAAVATVTIHDVLDSPEWEQSKGALRLALGRDVSGHAIVGDLAKMPHLLIAGATGSGKSVCINTIVGSLLYQFTPDELQLLMIDPKRVELVAFGEVPHLRLPLVTEMTKVVGALKWVVLEMDRRYTLFAHRGVRNLEGYNRWATGAGEPDEPPLPFLVVVIDELADMMMTAAEEVEKTLCRLAQLARATGIHLVVATQRPSVDVLTGLIKANFPTRIAFAVSSQTDSRVILDQAGAERLLGRGDALYMPTDAMKPVRIQGAFVSDDEIQALAAHWSEQGSPRYTRDEMAQVEALGRGDGEEDEETYDRAVELAETVGRVSVSLLQRRLGIGQGRARRLLDRLIEDGVAEE